MNKQSANPFDDMAKHLDEMQTYLYKHCERTLRLKECAEMLLDRLNEHGNIDHIREESVIEDLRNAISELDE